MPNPPPRFTSGGERARFVGQPRDEVDRVRLAVDDRLRVERLRPGEDVKPRQSAPAAISRLTKRRHAIGIDPERRGASAHPHPRSAQLEFGVHPHREPRRLADLLGEGERAVGFAFAFEVDRDPAADRQRQLAVGLARPGETDRLAEHRRSAPPFADRRGVEPVDQRRHRLEQRRRTDWPSRHSADRARRKRRAEPGDTRSATMLA